MFFLLLPLSKVQKLIMLITKRSLILINSLTHNGNTKKTYSAIEY